MVPLSVGQYDLVYEADWMKNKSENPTRVAVKTLKGDCMQIVTLHKVL